MEFPGSDLPNSNFRSHLSDRLLDARTIVVNEKLSPQVAGAIGEQVTLLEAESDEPIHIMMSNAPGGELDAGFSVYDLFHSGSAPITILASGRIEGAGVVGFLGPPREHRFALPHTRFRLEEPANRVDPGSADTLDREAAAAGRQYDRLVELLARETERSTDGIEDDLSDRRALDAEEAVDYGLITRVVQHRSEIE